ncbi:MAG: hypothetical protein JW839_02260 [Candidatus Lokiarchaeota archaeon]|nr:hypothetical protein [Candidatus Lokiarchaeota archaeon]
MEANNGNEAGSSKWNDFVSRNLPNVVRSDGKTERFDPNRIISSLLRETSIGEVEAKEVTEEITVKLLSSGHDMVTAPFIREQLCSIMYRKNPVWRFEYTRLGLPFRDFEKLLTGFFDKFKVESDLDEKGIQDVITTLDKRQLAELVRRMAKDYIGVRNSIKRGGEVSDLVTLDGDRP